MGSYSSVASFPASFRMILEPPGCSARKSVTYKSPLDLVKLHLPVAQVIYENIATVTAP